MTAVGRKYFHSFPRIRASDTQETTAAKGLHILELIKDIGLIAAPEIVEWHAPLQDGSRRTIKYEQVRICFTELDESELPEHARRFGPFALEFETDRLRQMGALPVIYMPQPLSSGDLSAVGAALVMQFHHIEATLRLLETLRVSTNEDELLAANPEATHVAPDCVMHLRNTEDDGGVTNEFSLPIGLVRDILSFIGFKNAPFSEMMNAIDYAKSLFYPTDDLIHDERLAYYRQREWRIGRGLSSAGAVHSRPLTEAEKQRVIDIDPRFWTTAIGTPPRPRIEMAHSIPKFGNSPVIEAISRFIVPAEAEQAARNLFGDKVICMDRLVR